MNIIISPYSRSLRNGEKNPKNYPFWKELIKFLKKDFDIFIIQIGMFSEEEIQGVDEVCFNLSLDDLKNLLLSCTFWISVDNFFPHFCSHLNKPGIVLWGRSDPEIFGYKQNLNLLKDRKYLRQYQFDMWEAIKYDDNVFLKPSEIIEFIKKF